jgi:beta-glucosidase-like glycosyl hydrolase/CubicO group peptidase (beta-lactamase class C family)
MKSLLLACALLLAVSTAAQTRLTQQQWVDSVFNSLTDDQRITQLIVVRLSERLAGNKVAFYDKQVEAAIRQYNIGGICLFQGGPVKQAGHVNFFQQIAQTPIMICIDGEYGVGMRFDSVGRFPYQLTMGAMNDAALVYEIGKAMGQQCRRAGIHVNYAPVVDVNNNPNNPVINFRSFGEDRYKVGLFGVQIMKGMQDMGVMACAKHFPGHGDTETDSHYDLPIINKTRPQLDSLELYPFREVFKNGIGSVMIAHLSIPVIDNTKNRPTSLSYNNVTNLMRKELGYNGLTFTDALEMKGVKKFFPDGEASAQSLIAGNDMLCLPGDIPAAIAKIREAIKKKKMSWEDLYAKTKRVLAAKYQYVLPNAGPISTAGITAELNAKVSDLRTRVAENAITLLRRAAGHQLPGQLPKGTKLAYVCIGASGENTMTAYMRSTFKADVFYFNYRQDNARIASLAELIRRRYGAVIIGIHNYAPAPANNFGISAPAIRLAKELQQLPNATTLVFGNPYALKNFADAPTLYACYEDDAIFHEVTTRILQGSLPARGKLPVTVTETLQFGNGIVYQNRLPEAAPATAGLDAAKLQAIDSIAADGIRQGAMPGCMVLVAKAGRVVYRKAFGYYTYEQRQPVTPESIYDLASVTKISATTMAVMKLADEGKLDIKKKLGDYLPWVKGSDKENLVLEDILLHQAGLKAWIPFYRETIDTTTGAPLPGIYRTQPDALYNVPVADQLFMCKHWLDTMYKRILQSPLGVAGKYVYSDNDFIFLGKIVEALSGTTLDDYVKKNFYAPLDMRSTGFNPHARFSPLQLVPTEAEKMFRRQLLRGFVHDPGAAMFGGVAGHAGLFSTADDLAVLYQTLLNGGSFGGQRYLNEATIKNFTDYHSPVSRRALGFDKPEKDNATRREPYPCKSASPQTFGHTGFTGTCVWADPAHQLLFIFLSNRVHPQGGDNQLLLKMNIRGNMMEAVYAAML